MVDDIAYVHVGGSSSYFNEKDQMILNLSDDLEKTVRDLGGYAYAFIVDKEVAKKDLGLTIDETVFNKDPIGWTLIFVAGVGLIYVAIKLTFFKKKVKVLK